MDSLESHRRCCLLPRTPPGLCPSSCQNAAKVVIRMLRSLCSPRSPGCHLISRSLSTPSQVPGPWFLGWALSHPCREALSALLRPWAFALAGPGCFRDPRRHLPLSGIGRCGRVLIHLPPQRGVGRCRPATTWTQDDFLEDGETLPLLNLFQGCLLLKRSPRGSFQGQGWPGHSKQRSFGDTSVGWGGGIVAMSRAPQGRA